MWLLSSNRAGTSKPTPNQPLQQPGRALRPGHQDDCSMVSAPPTRVGRGSAPHSESETSGPLCVLRHHGQWHDHWAIPYRSAADLEEVAGPSASPAWLLFLGLVRSAPEAFCASPGPRGPLGVPSGTRTRDLTSRMR